MIRNLILVVVGVAFLTILGYLTWLWSSVKNYVEERPYLLAAMMACVVSLILLLLTIQLEWSSWFALGASVVVCVTVVLLWAKFDPFRVYIPATASIIGLSLSALLCFTNIENIDKHPTGPTPIVQSVEAEDTMSFKSVSNSSVPSVSREPSIAASRDTLSLKSVSNASVPLSLGSETVPREPTPSIGRRSLSNNSFSSALTSPTSERDDESIIIPRIVPGSSREAEIAANQMRSQASDNRSLSSQGSRTLVPSNRSRQGSILSNASQATMIPRARQGSILSLESNVSNASKASSATMIPVGNPSLDKYDSVSIGDVSDLL